MKTEIIPNELLFEDVRRLINEGKRVTLNVKGQSMLPFIHGDRDQVVLEKARQVKIGDILLCEISKGQYVLHRLIAIRGNSLQLMGDGNCYATEKCSFSDVVGRATLILQPDGKTLICGSPSEKRKAHLWVFLRPVRRYLLAIYKRLIIHKHK